MLFWRAVPIPRLDIYNPVILGDKEKGKTSRGACNIKCFAVVINFLAQKAWKVCCSHSLSP
jgi:hypothetical protein